MIHQPQHIVDCLPPYAIALAEHGRNGRLVVYAGAGMSFAEPTGLPSGAQVARILYDRLKGPFPDIEECDPTDLTAVADAVAAQPGAKEALRLSVARTAEFTTARPAYGHQILALLLLEGVVDALTTNWDDCIERSGGAERVPAVVTETDLLGIPTRSLLKIHGCATRPASLLVTTDDLEDPPSWVGDQTRARLGTSVVAFVGIGDIAGYVQRRIEEAVESVGELENIRIVSPGVAKNWSSLDWSELTPELPIEHRIAATADSFLERVGAAYVHTCLQELAAKFSADDRLASAATAAAVAIEQHDALSVLLWVRTAAVVAEPGKSVLDEQTVSSAVLALGLLFADGFRISGQHFFVVAGKEKFEVVAAVGAQPASRLRREMKNRLELHLGRGLQPPTFLVAGGVGWKDAEDAEPLDIIGTGDSDDLIDGPLSSEPDVLRAEQVVG